ncbi:hypothetical protein PIROE2DRAFT_8306 [Piromyces sp. E2]|nr:hypothetical protein PIROE2DRAFT_8306 [Piromyces sp. E2]|eukprot:OUM64841.1 hypothetical protein PIROE2DRAFT_8306 [Piromyces sp. E2]
MLYKLLVNFPEKNKVSLWISKNKYIFISIFIFIDLILILINIVSPFEINTVESFTHNNYQECKMDENYFQFNIYLNIFVKFILFIGITILCFIEWNINETLNDVRILMTSIYSNIVSYIGVLIIKYIEDNNHDIFDIIYKSFIIIFILSNYLFTFGIRIILKMNRKKDDFKVNKINNKEETYHSSMTSTKMSISHSSKIRILMDKIISYHNKTSIIEDSNYSLNKSSIENSTL